MVDKLSERLRIEPTAIRLDEPLVALGVDSMQFVVLVGELEDWLGCRFASNPLLDYPSVNALSQYLARQLQTGKTVIDPPSD
ncbi:MAG: acyl carrier protein [Candidatus Saccharimonas sp.]|nr:acyl carrier protein [Planctomycetaceae bacterium]